MALAQGLTILFTGTFQLAQVVGIAEGVEAIVAEVGFPVVVAENVVESGQNADLVHGLGAASVSGESPSGRARRRAVHSRTARLIRPAHC